MRFDSDKSFDELRDDLLADIGAQPAEITDLPALATRDWDAFAADEDGSRSSLTYVKPSSLMVVDDNPPLRKAALVLDNKLATLARRIASTGDAH